MPQNERFSARAPSPHELFFSPHSISRKPRAGLKFITQFSFLFPRYMAPQVYSQFWPSISYLGSLSQHSDAAVTSFSPSAVDQPLAWLSCRDSEATGYLEGRRMVLHYSFLRPLRSPEHFQLFPLLYLTSCAWHHRLLCEFKIYSSSDSSTCLHWPPRLLTGPCWNV